jgi:hypothetical protein
MTRKDDRRQMECHRKSAQMSNQAKTTAVGKCRERTKAGRQCAAPAVRGDAYCAIRADPAEQPNWVARGGLGKALCRFARWRQWPTFVDSGELFPDHR